MGCSALGWSVACQAELDCCEGSGSEAIESFLFEVSLGFQDTQQLGLQ